MQKKVNPSADGALLTRKMGVRPTYKKIKDSIRRLNNLFFDYYLVKLNPLRKVESLNKKVQSSDE